MVNVYSHLKQIHLLVLVLYLHSVIKQIQIKLLVKAEVMLAIGALQQPIAQLLQVVILKHV